MENDVVPLEKLRLLIKEEREAYAKALIEDKVCAKAQAIYRRIKHLEGFISLCLMDHLS